MAVEFNCCECTRHIVAVGALAVPQPPLCAECLYMPGWHEDLQLSQILGGVNRTDAHLGEE